MKNPLNVKFLRKSLADLISHQPIQVQQWVLLPGNSFSTPNSWVFSWSWVGMLTPVGREVFRAFTTDAGSAGSKNYVVILPYGGSNTVIPKVNSQLVLYDMNGRSQGRFKINFVNTFSADTAGVKQDTLWQIQCHCELLE